MLIEHFFVKNGSDFILLDPKKPNLNKNHLQLLH